MKVVCIIQARMGSTRLPGKVMMDIAGKTMLERTFERASRAMLIDQTLVATTILPEDDKIRNFCAAKSWRVFSGSSDDVLDRYYRAAREVGAEAIVRITSDCPLIDPEVTNGVVEAFLAEHGVDYACNVLPKRTYPRGLDTEVFTWEALERAWTEDKNPLTREHVTQYMQKTPGRFRQKGVMNDVDYSRYRWTVDEPRDIELVRTIYARLGRDDFGWRDVVALLEREPRLVEINRDVEQKKVP